MFEIMEIMDALKDTKGIKYKILKTRINASLKRNFFDKFSIPNINLDYGLIREVLCMHESDRFDKNSFNQFIKLDKLDFPIVTSVEFSFRLKLEIQFYEYVLTICPAANENGRWNIIISNDDPETGKEISFSMFPKTDYVNTDSKLKSIILMSIYNYCVVYVYGKDSLGKYKNLIKRK